MHNVNMSELLQEDSRFACLATSVNPVHGLEAPISLSDSLMFTPGPPFELDELRRNTLGSFCVEKMQSANFCLLLHEHPSRHDGSNGEHGSLFGRVQSVLECVLLSGIPEVDDPQVFAGTWHEGGAIISSFGSGRRYYYSPQLRPRPVTAGSLRVAGSAFAALERMWASTGRYLRLRAGYEALTRVMRDGDSDFRLHQCVRAGGCPELS